MPGCVDQLIAGRLLSEAVLVTGGHALATELATACRERQLSFENPWTENPRWDATSKDWVRGLLGVKTAEDRAWARRIQAARRRRTNEVRRAARGELGSHPLWLQIVGAGRANDLNAAHARRVLAAYSLGRLRHPRVLLPKFRRRSPARRPNCSARGRSRRNTRAGPGDDDEGGPAGRARARRICTTAGRDA